MVFKMIALVKRNFLNQKKTEEEIEKRGST